MRHFGNMGMLGAILALGMAPLATAVPIRRVEEPDDFEPAPTPKAKRHRASSPRRHPSVSKYTPHQGEQEKARRVRQMARIAAKREARLQTIRDEIDATITFAAA